MFECGRVGQAAADLFEYMNAPSAALIVSATGKSETILALLQAVLRLIARLKDRIGVNLFARTCSENPDLPSFERGPKVPGQDLTGAVCNKGRSALTELRPEGVEAVIEAIRNVDLNTRCVRRRGLQSVFQRERKRGRITEKAMLRNTLDSQSTLREALVTSDGERG